MCTVQEMALSQSKCYGCVQVPKKRQCVQEQEMAWSQSKCEGCVQVLKKRQCVQYRELMSILMLWVCTCTEEKVMCTGTGNGIKST
jgi:hypothetical protein